jgi:PTS system galactitol-specific IIA component
LGGDINAAIPHTDIEHVVKSGLGMATLVNPVTFQNMIAPDEAVPVRLVFILALDQPKAQIEMLQEIAGVLQNPDLVARLMQARDFDGIKAALS